MSTIESGSAHSLVRIGVFALLAAACVGGVTAVTVEAFTSISGDAVRVVVGAVFLGVFGGSIYSADAGVRTVADRWVSGSALLVVVALVGFAVGTVTGQFGPLFGVLGLVAGAIVAFLTISSLTAVRSPRR